MVGAGQASAVMITVAQLATTADGQGRLTSNGTILTNGAKTTVTLYPGGAAQTSTETPAPVVAPTPALTSPFAGGQTGG